MLSFCLRIPQRGAQDTGLSRKRERLTSFLESMRKGRHQTDEHWNCFEAHGGETSERHNVECLWAFVSAWIPS